MKKLVLVFLIFACPLFAQKEANIWYFGDKAGLNFNTGNPEALLDSQISTDGGCASISDSSGNLLFYTNGLEVYNRDQKLMLNGDGLKGDSNSSHSALIIPKPNSTSIYYIFTVDDRAGPDGLQYSEVDMNLDGGLGGITSKKNILLFTPTTEKLTAIKSSSSDEYWLISHKWNSNEFLAYKVTSSGVNTSPIVSAVGTHVEGVPGFFETLAAQGTIKVSPDGTKLAVARGEGIDKAELYDFNPNTGIVSNPLTLTTLPNSTPYGIEFSPNSKVLYVSFYNFGPTNGVYQYDLSSNNFSTILNSVVKLTTNDIGYTAMQLATDGKIYISKVTDHLDVIEKPNIIGSGSNYLFDEVSLGGRGAKFGLPPFIQTYLQIQPFSFKNLCFNNSTEFTLTETVDSATWNFGDPDSGALNTSTLFNPTHVFSKTGNFEVSVTITIGSNTTTLKETITIYKNPSATKPSNILICDDNNDGFYNFNLTTQTKSILNGQNDSEFEVDYFANMTDYNDENKISDYTSYKNASSYQEQSIIARVRNKQNSDCETITSFKINVFKSPTTALSSEIPNLTDCDNTSVGTDIDGEIKFNLKNRETVILNGQSLTEFMVTYYEDENLTQLINNPTGYINTSATQRIHVKVENKQNINCFAKTSFLLEVFELPIINASVSLKQCDNVDINGFSSINLNEAKEKIVLNSQNFTITFFEEKTFAEGNTNPITNPTTYTNQTVSNDKVWARVENSNGCFRVSEVNLIVSTTQIPVTFSKVFYKCDDGTNATDGIATFNFSLVTQEVKDLFPVNQKLIINYYRNEADALAELNAITDITNYQNIGYPNQQDIYIRVDSEVDNDCLGLGHHITLNVEKMPIANPVIINPECDNDRDGLFAFDTSNIQSTIIGNQTNVVVSYIDENNNPLSSPLPNPFITGSQTIKARIVNTISQDPNGQCFDEITIDFVVNSTPVANIVTPQEQCENDFDGIVDFDTSNIQSTILGTQTDMIVKYFDQNNNPLPSPLPNPFTITSQTIRVRVENPQYALCYDETSIDFIVREKPYFELEKEATICITENPLLEIMAENPQGNYTYRWKNEKGDIISEQINAEIKNGGIYSVTATSNYGCSSETKTITVKESGKATIKNEDFEIIDDTSNNSIKIITTNLGLGSYEYSLLNEKKHYVYDFQDEPFFSNLDGGVYTIVIRDKNGCGSISYDVSVIQFPKFFTPNEDGVNDTWNVKGFNNNFYSNGEVIIFNRYGKKIANFRPNSIGWQGFYKGKRLPSDDYWFIIKLIDKNGIVRKRKGHFSMIR